VARLVAGEETMSNLLGGLVNGPMAIRTSEGIAHVIRKAILAGILPPGEQLPERKLAEELSVSRTPVREALFTLQGEGLVDLVPGRCARVREVSPTEVRRIFALRRILEAHAARCAAENPDRSKLDRAEDALAAFKRIGASGSAADQASADLAFHEAIAAAAGSPLLVTLMRQVLAVTVTYRSAHKYTSARTRRVYAQHDAILKAIQAGDASEAERLMGEHISESSELALKHVRKADVGSIGGKQPIQE
jgi:DNA-binding GntR family transcriptional regulator